MLHAINKDIDQPSHPSCLVSAFVIHSPESKIIAYLTARRVSRSVFVVCLDFDLDRSPQNWVSHNSAYKRLWTTNIMNSQNIIAY